MCGMLQLQRLLSDQMAQRRFLLRPPEPAPEQLVSSPSKSVYIGKTQFLHVPFFWDPEKLVNPHLCIVGITGSGKSYFVKTFITRASIALKSKFLILDWAGEYADWVKSAGGKVIEFGKQGINLLDLGGTTPHTRTRQVMGSLEMLTDISSFPHQRRLTEEAIEKAYQLRGFSLHRQNKRKKPPTLEAVFSVLRKKSKKSTESAEAARRIKNLLLSSRGSFSSHTIKLEELISGIVCIDLHSLPTESLRSLAGLAILQFVKEKMRSQPYCNSRLPGLFVVADEAWKIAADSRSDIVSIVREGRKYGFGLIVASQNPTDIHKSIFSNAGTVAAFRLMLSSERKYLRASLAYSDLLEALSHSFSVGQALVHLEFASPVCCPRTFIVEKVDGEGLLITLSIRGGGVNLEFEKNELAKHLLSFGLTDRQTSSLLSEFERHSYSLEAADLVLFLEKFGYSRASAVSLLRRIGAREKELLSLFSSIRKGSTGAGRREALVFLAEKKQKPGKRKKR